MTAVDSAEDWTGGRENHGLEEGKERKGKKKRKEQKRKEKDLEIPLASRLDKHKSRSNSRLDWILLSYVEERKEGSSLLIIFLFPFGKQRGTLYLEARAGNCVCSRERGRDNCKWMTSPREKKKKKRLFGICHGSYYYF